MTNMDESASWVDGAKGKALSFDGTNDEMTIPEVAGEIKTIAFWINPDENQNSDVFTVFEIKPLNDNNYFIQSVNGGSSLKFRKHQNYHTTYSESNASDNLITSGWVHVAFRWDGAKSAYDLLTNGKDGNETTDNTHVPLQINLSSLQMTSTYAGKLDDLRIYSRSLSDAEIQALCDQDGDGLNDAREAELGTNPNNPDTDGDGDPDSNETAAGSSPTNPNETILGQTFTNGLQVHLKFDETNGTTAHDSSGNNRYAELHGVDGNGSTWKAGKFGGALKLDGVDDWGTVPGSIERNSTVAFWIKTTDNYSNSNTGFDSSKTILGGSEKLGIMFNQRKFRYYSSGAGGPNVAAKVVSPTAITEDLWWHCTAVTEINPSSSGKNDFKIYINGSYNSGVDSKSFEAVGSPLFLGKNGSRYLSALLDDLRIYDRVLSGAEVQALYNLGQ